VKVSESERECIVLLLVPSRIVNCESMWRIASGRGGRVKTQVSRLRLASQSDLKSDTCADSTCSYTAVHLRVRFIYERTYVPLPLPNTCYRTPKRKRTGFTSLPRLHRR
jgi:hypothetical protein